ncbi:MAG: molybdopterin-dependent oxidoreductase [Candidatus Thorarchaeota archaeon]
MEKKFRFGTCTKDCYGACVFNGIWDDMNRERKFIKAVPLKNHPFTNGFFCPKYKNRQNLVYHSDRIKKTLLRINTKPSNDFKPISNREALDLISQRIIERESENPKSVIGAFFSGNTGLISMYSPLRFFAKFGATVTNGGICNEGGCAGLKELFGTYSISNPFQIIDPYTRLIIIWGSDLSERNIHAYFLVKQAIKNNSKLIVIDSKLTEIAKKSDLFLHIHPGTEYLLARILLKALIKQDAHDIKFLKENVDGYNILISKLEDFNEKVFISQIGIDVDSLQEFVQLLIKYKHQTLFMIGYGVQKDIIGGRIIQFIALIQVLLGNIGKRGTGLIYSQSDFMNPIIHQAIEYITGIDAFPGLNEIPLIKLGEALSSGNYKLIFIYNFNPASSLPNQNTFRKALMRRDLFVVVLDMFLNETTKYADVVIPAKFDLESYDIIKPYYIPSLSINIGGPCPYSDCMSNYEFFQQLAHKIGYDNLPFFNETEEMIFNKFLNFLPSKIRKNLLTNGYHLLFNQKQIPFSNLKFLTSNQKIQIRSLNFGLGKDFIKQKLKRKQNEFILISPSHPFYIHSQIGQLNPSYAKDFSKVFLNPNDINMLDLQLEDEVIVLNEFGTARFFLAELKSLKPGTALIYSGGSFPHEKRPNVNIYTSDIPEELGLSGAYYSTKIQIQRVS